MTFDCHVFFSFAHWKLCGSLGWCGGGGGGASWMRSKGIDEEVWVSSQSWIYSFIYYSKLMQSVCYWGCKTNIIYCFIFFPKKTQLLLNWVYQTNTMLYRILILACMASSIRRCSSSGISSISIISSNRRRSWRKSSWGGVVEVAVVVVVE